MQEGHVRCQHCESSRTTCQQEWVVPSVFPFQQLPAGDTRVSMWLERGALFCQSKSLGGPQTQAALKQQ